MYIMGENPAMSDPDQNHVRAALEKLDCLVVQDIFPTETAAFADIILPASAFPEKQALLQIQIEEYSLKDRLYLHLEMQNKITGLFKK